MKKQSRQGSVLIYTIFLMSIALIMAMVILNLSTEIFNNNEYQSIIRKLANNITYKAGLAFKYDKAMNSDGSGYIDATSCPTSITMSGTVSMATVSSSITYTGGKLFCSGTYSGTGFQITWNDGYGSFTGATFQGYAIFFASGTTYSGTFPDSDNTKITFSGVGLGGIDNIDDNMNSDNYSVTSTGNIYYPNGYEDDDVLARKSIYFYLPPGGGFTNILWNTKKYMDTITQNPNNIDNLNQPMGQVSSGVLYLDVDHSFRLKVVTFNKSKYTTYNELEPTQVPLTSQEMFGRLGYIQNDGTVSTGGLAKTGNEKIFDFVNNLYGIFLQNTSTGTLLFNMKGYTTAGTGMYIVPLDDNTGSTLARYVGNDIIIDSDGKYLQNQFEVVNVK